MLRNPDWPSWKVLAASVGAAVVSGVAQAVAESGLDGEAVVVAVCSAVGTLLLGYVVPEGNPPRSALDD